MKQDKYKSKAMYNKVPDKAPFDPDNQKHQLGSGYFLPKSVPKAAFISLLKTWEDKLAKSGFKDIEYRDENGKVLTFFRDYTSAANTHKLYKPETETYYMYAREFYQTFNWYHHFDAKNAPIHRLIFYFFSEGVSYRKILKILQGTPPSKLTSAPYRVPPKVIGKYSIFFVHSRNQKSLEFFKSWLDEKLATPSDSV